jgi:hypothetical protein
MGYQQYTDGQTDITDTDTGITDSCGIFSYDLSQQKISFPF